MKQADQGKSKQYYFFKSLTYLKPYKGLCAVCISSCVIAAALSVLFPVFTEKTLTAFTNHDGQALLISASLLLLFQVAHSVTNMILWGNSADKLRAKITKDMRYDAVNSIMNLSTRNFDLYGSGKLLQVVSSDTASLSSLYTSIVDVTMCLLSKITVYIYIFAANYLLGLYCLLEFVVVCWVYHFRIRARIKGQIKLKKAADKNIGFVNESIRGVRDIKNYNIQSAMLAKTDESLTALEKADSKFGSRQYQLFRMTTITKNVMTFLFIPLALLLIHYDLATFPVAFTIFIFRSDTTSVIDWVMNTWEHIKDGGIYAERIFHVIEGYHAGFEAFPTQDNFEQLAEPLDVEIKNLTFGYDEHETIFKNFNLKIEHGSKIALVGESGSGKSTLLKLLNRTYDVGRGQIFIGGQDVCDFSKATLRNTITIVPQDPYIFNFSFAENLKIINPQADEQAMIDACQKAQIHDFIMAQPEQYATVLGEGGSRLSGGQKQRLAIARAFLKDSPILIFDETTSALDNENQSKIKAAIDGIGRNKIVIIVAHRLSTIVDADKIYFLQDGQILTSGTHAELLATCPAYKRLYEQESVGQED